MTNATIESPTTMSPLEQASAELTLKRRELSEAEKAHAEFRAKLEAASKKGDIDALATIAIDFANAGTDVARLTKVVEGLQVKHTRLNAQAQAESIKTQLDNMREAVANLVGAETLATLKAAGYKAINMKIDLTVESGNPTVSTRFEGGPKASSGSTSTGSRTPRNAKWQRGDEVFDKAVDVVAKYGHNHPAASKSGNPAEWVERKVAYAKDATSIARDLGFAPVV